MSRLTLTLSLVLNWLATSTAVAMIGSGGRHEAITPTVADILYHALLPFISLLSPILLVMYPSDWIPDITALKVVVMFVLAGILGYAIMRAFEKPSHWRVLVAHLSIIAFFILLAAIGTIHSNIDL